MLRVLQDLVKQDLFLVVIVKEIFDRFQFVGGNNTWVRKQLVHDEIFKLFLAFNQSFLFVSLEVGLLLKRPCWQVKCLRGFIDETTCVQGIRNLGPEPSNFIGEKLDVLRFFSTGDDFYRCFLKRFRFLDQCFELGNPSFPDNLIRIAFPGESPPSRSSSGSAFSKLSEGRSGHRHLRRRSRWHYGRGF